MAGGGPDSIVDGFATQLTCAVPGSPIQSTPGKQQLQPAGHSVGASGGILYEGITMAMVT